MKIFKQPVSGSFEQNVSPIFKIVHTDFYEKGNDGLNYLNPFNSGWTVSDSKTKAKFRKSKLGSPEGFIKIEGVFASKDEKISIESLGGFPNALGLFSNSNLPWGHATHIRLRVSSSNPDQVHTLLIGEEPQALKISFKATAKASDVVIELPAVELAWEFSRKLKFEWLQSSSSKIDLTIFGPVVFERNIFFMNSRARDYVLDQSYSHDRKEKDTHRNILEMALNNLAEPRNIEFALSVGRQGESETLKVLSKIYRFHVVELKKKIESADFFARMARGVDLPILPIERGTFAEEHGAYVHALQLLAMTRGMTSEQVTAFFEGPYRGIFDLATDRWAAWDLIFDAPGDFTPNSPLWWRKQLENE